jgi:hypothetical protein
MIAHTFFIYVTKDHSFDSPFGEMLEKFEEQKIPFLQPHFGHNLMQIQRLNLTRYLKQLQQSLFSRSKISSRI